MTEVLFVLSEEGYWAEECTAPLSVCDEAGVGVSVATPSGSPPVVDERSTDPDEVGEETARAVEDRIESDDRFQNPTPIARESAGDYDGVVFPGGHGTVWDVNQDAHARRLLRSAVSGGGVALVICHAVGLLAFTRDDEVSFLVEGRRVTGFPNAWEDDIVDENDVLPDGRKLPYRVEDEVRAAGGQWSADPQADESVAVHGSLITARGPESSRAGARKFVDALGTATEA